MPWSEIKRNLLPSTNRTFKQSFRAVKGLVSYKCCSIEFHYKRMMPLGSLNLKIEGISLLNEVIVIYRIVL